MTTHAFRLTGLALLASACIQPKLDDSLGDEASESSDTTGESESSDTEGCAPQDAFGEDIQGGPTGQFYWDGTQCFELFYPDLCTGEDCDMLFDSAESCFAAHSHCFDAEQCELGPVGITDVSGQLAEQAHVLQAGMFRNEWLRLGPDATVLGVLLYTHFSWLEAWYPQVVAVESLDGAWHVGVQDVSVTELGSWTSSPGTVTIDSVETEGNPSTWRLVGQITVDDGPEQLTGSFVVAGCVEPFG